MTQKRDFQDAMRKLEGIRKRTRDGLTPKEREVLDQKEGREATQEEIREAEKMAIGKMMNRRARMQNSGQHFTTNDLDLTRSIANPGDTITVDSNDEDSPTLYIVELDGSVTRLVPDGTN